MTMHKKYRLSRSALSPALAFFLIGALCFGNTAGASDVKTYVGSEVCAKCHESEYTNYTKSSKKSHSFKSVMRMKKGLSESELKDCYACHTTGYGKPGGFVSEEETPKLKNAGCEVCHGPGSRHVQTQDPKDIESKVKADLCKSCHNSERIDAFRYNPALFAGAH
jgi:hypothetical protein